MCSGMNPCAVARKPTRFRTETEGLVAVVVVSGGTPAVPIVPASGGAAIVRVTLEGERELAGGTICVASKGEQHCNTKQRNAPQFVPSVWEASAKKKKTIEYTDII